MRGGREIGPDRGRRVPAGDRAADRAVSRLQGPRADCDHIRRGSAERTERRLRFMLQPAGVSEPPGDRKHDDGHDHHCRPGIPPRDRPRDQRRRRRGRRQIPARRAAPVRRQQARVPTQARAPRPSRPRVRRRHDDDPDDDPDERRPRRRPRRRGPRRQRLLRPQARHPPPQARPPPRPPPRRRPACRAPAGDRSDWY